ncbi:hypothetical protein PMIN06_003554 [Paraphaeosphaeria minitans]|uniref:Uncharacterized protein n=1 Tax=Paraphaeosphaeria minitans TaxID=565426 RepID=A0A9P6KUM3_9PLEO|nr:hypothetical protein PMIN01_01588 [Paraphaeosphaeria minitans]
MVDNRTNAPRRRSLRDAPPLPSGSRNTRRDSGADRRRERTRARSSSPPRRRAHSRDRERERERERDVTWDTAKRHQHTKNSTRTRTRTRSTANIDHYSPPARTPAKRPTTSPPRPARRTNPLAISSPHEDRTVLDATAAHAARSSENSPDRCIASEDDAAPAHFPPLRNVCRHPALVNDILLESLRVVDYLQRSTVSDARPYRASPEVAGYLEHLRERCPGALVGGRMDGQGRSLERVGSVGVGGSVTSAVADLEGADGAGDAGEAGPGDAAGAGPDWYNAAWGDDSDDAAKGDV